MGQCYAKNIRVQWEEPTVSASSQDPSSAIPVHYVNNTYSYASTPQPSPLPAGVPPPPARATPRRFFRRAFPPPSPAKHIQAFLLKRHGAPKAIQAPLPEGVLSEEDKPLDKSFGYNKNFGAGYELGQEVGRGHFGHTCHAKVRRELLKGQSVAVKVISKDKITTAIGIEDVRREVKILKALSGHRNLIRYHVACEDNNNVYIIMQVIFYIGVVISIWAWQNFKEVFEEALEDKN